MTGTTQMVIAGSAVFYCIAMIAMKLWDSMPLALGIALVAAALAGAAAFEIAALRIERLGFVYIAILGAECIIMAAVSFFMFGEAYSPRELAGAALVIAGAVVAST